MAQCFGEDSQVTQTLPALIRHQALRKRQIASIHVSASGSASAATIHSVAHRQLSVSASASARPTRSAAYASLRSHATPIATPTGLFLGPNATSFNATDAGNSNGTVKNINMCESLNPESCSYFNFLQIVRSCRGQQKAGSTSDDNQAMNSHIEEGPRLSLRGGGASSKRKEVRRHKFRTETTPSKPNISIASEHRASSVSSPTNDPTPSPADEDKQIEPAAANETQPSETKPHRFVVFVATDASVQQHFATLKPTSIRHRREKTTGKSKGFVFLEFDAYDRLKTCLKTFHHSKFDDGISPARPLNVELTAGGGGSKSKDRRVKLKVKNEKLRQERERRGKSVGGPKPAQKVVCEQSDHQDVHPSRRARVGGSS
ncbi:MAG: hypothetical protein Q9171_001159 [Xanthocarpia ochracea]